MRYKTHAGGWQGLNYNEGFGRIIMAAAWLEVDVRGRPSFLSPFIS